ncbi:hypothetical protein ABE522_08015 [Stenotrophomonas pennii]|uniref:hypothetical protein n=1 Tax=Stenotrophomonas lacuserhaii TaxID=2760084 RepID=UPI0032089AAC
MSPRLDAGTRLYALIGEAIHNLPPRFVSRLEAILIAQEGVQPACMPEHAAIDAAAVAHNAVP